MLWYQEGGNQWNGTPGDEGDSGRNCRLKRFCTAWLAHTQLVSRVRFQDIMPHQGICHLRGELPGQSPALIDARELLTLLVRLCAKGLRLSHKVGCSKSD